MLTVRCFRFPDDESSPRSRAELISTRRRCADRVHTYLDDEETREGTPIVDERTQFCHGRLLLVFGSLDAVRE